MAVYCITYELKSPNKDYKPVYEYLKGFPYCKGLESFWLIDTSKSAQQIREDLKNRVHGRDNVFVGRLTRNWASLNLACGNWLNRDTRNW